MPGEQPGPGSGPPDDVVAHLRAEVERHDPETRPIQHATARFHLGSTLLAAGDAAAAADELAAAADGFPRDGLPVEHAKARMMGGVALRDLGRTEEASRAFADAAGLFAANDHRLEEAAARHNRGLVSRDAGDEATAAAAFEHALAVFEEADARAQATATARELGTSLFAMGELGRAREVLVRAQELARRAGDRAALGAAANVLGVVALADDDPEAAAAAFRDAAGAHPRSVRPSAHAMARSNLALAHDRAGRPAHAALVARQALAMAALPADARQQADEVAGRCRTDGDPLTAVLATAAPGDHAGLLRAELARVLATGPQAGAEHAAAVAVAVAQHEDRVALTEVWLDAVLEQPPEVFAALLEGYVAAAERDEATRDAVATALRRAVVRFHAPQMLRVSDTVAQAAESRGAVASWG